MKLDLQDFAIRGLFVLAGIVAAVLLTMKGYGQALPGAAIGGALGAWFVARVQSSTPQE
jgi:hypothetical protein